MVATPCAAKPARISIPAGPLHEAIVQFGIQAGVTVGLSDQTLAGIRVRGVGGRLKPADALKRMLRGSAATFVQGDPTTFRIVRRVASGGAAQADLVVPGAIESNADIVVRATKREVSLADYAGSIAVADTATLRPNQLARGSDALVELLPILSSTHLGPGRNKLFIRGIADSSFSGPTQATVGQYLGDVRLNYSAPDPNLALYDVASVEILEGPQGTLYGAGSLGGIFRLVPNPPSMTVASQSIQGGVATTRHGAASADIAAVADLPIVQGRLGIRAVGYLNGEGGYIDDPQRRLSNVNDTLTRGGRVTVRFRPTDSWTIDVGGVVQDIASRDGQYAERGLGPLRHASAIAQPFDNDYALASLTVQHDTGASTLTSVSSAVSHDRVTTFDASAGGGPRVYHEAERIMLLSNETRLARRTSNGGWLIGLEVLQSDDRSSRTLGVPGEPPDLAGTRNVVSEGSIFGEFTRSLTDALSITGGARFVFSRLVAQARADPIDEDREPGRHSASVLPSIGLLWSPHPWLSIFTRYQEGSRPGGLTAGDVTARFKSDTVSSVEAGVRLGTPADTFSGNATVSRVRWKDIQADLVGTTGLPFIANVGSGYVVGFEAQGAWRLSRDLVLDGAAFLNSSGLERPASGFGDNRGDSLPNVAAMNFRGGFRANLPVGRRSVELSGSIRYVGRSRLGVGELLDLGQGRYVDTALGASVPVGRIALSLDATNLFDERGNTFALGNPFTVTDRRQITPLRPRTIRLGARVAF
ncbi:TonB-dependent receptor [Sphingomonas sp. KR1UV-12]|uniref:TonB-dependent receptor n=1 Tax=Sphingomonas aurea TaxID=3063994 RepID=A0ABT9EKU2_9SPHN|nr:TonB-dependent receptor [Sphingomonas sp. KR1UV-12]MDP1027585.1 TonB-dependent receptor [Sphingomonas sp. KR1UV-12]